MLLEKLRGSEVKTRLLNPHEEYWDRKLGIHTFGYHPGTDRSNPEHFNYYMPTSYADLFRIYRHVGLGPSDVFVDLGSGMGRAVFLASHMGARKAIGLELVPWLHDAAEANRKRGTWPNVEFHCGDARETVFPDVTVLAMFNPFGPAIIEAMLAKLQEKRTGDLKLIYVNPLHESALERSGWLRKVGELPKARNLTGTRMRFDASIWRSR